MSGNVFDTNQNNIFHFTSPVSTYHLTNEEMQINLPETVIYAADAPITLKCELINWSPKNATITGTGQVITQYKNTTMKSHSSITTSLLKTLPFSGDAHAFINYRLIYTAFIKHLKIDISMNKRIPAKLTQGLHKDEKIQKRKA